MKINKKLDKIKMFLPSNEVLLMKSSGEIINAETYHYRTLKPVVGGLFCEQIFGPEQSYKCLCDKVYFNNKNMYKCKKCNVLFTNKNVRRVRFGHIKLHTYVVSPLFYKSPYILSKIFNLNSNDLQSVIHYDSYFAFKKNDLLDIKFISDLEIDKIKEELLKQEYCIGTGAEILREYSLCINLKEEIEKLINKKTLTLKLSKRLSILQKLQKNNVSLEHFFTNIVMVFPANLRPIYIPRSEGFLGSSDLNFLYKEIIIRNKIILKLLSLDAPEVLQNFAKASLQLSFDKLIDNRSGNNGKSNAFSLQTKKKHKSLMEYLITKHGILRKYILGKRNDFTARSVIVVDPKLKLGECSIPVSMAKDLLEPFIKRELLRTGLAKNLFEAEYIIENEQNLLINILQKLLKSHLFLLNRAPTLHRYGIQAFKVKLNNEKTIGVHPLNCKAFNSDFDGDQQGVHSSFLSQDITESHFLMTPQVNLFSMINGNCILKPNRLMLLGLYYATVMDKIVKNKEYSYYLMQDIVWLYRNNQIKIHKIINLIYQNKIITTSVGRILFNFYTLNKDMYDFDIFLTGKTLDKLINKIFIKGGISWVIDFLDKAKDFGNMISKKVGLTFSLFDLIIPKSRQKLFDSALKQNLELQENYINQKIAEDEYKESSIEMWNNTFEKLTKDLIQENGARSDHFLMINSGARSNILQIRQLCGFIGLINLRTSKQVLPILSSFKDGLSPLETFVATFGSRDSSISKNLRTADTGFLNRRIVLSLNEYMIKEHDCRTTEYLKYDLKEITSKDWKTFIFGRVLFDDFVVNGKVILRKNSLLVKQNYNILSSFYNTKNIIKVRTVLKCKSSKSPYSLCSLCFGADLSSLSLISIGENVGVQTAQTLSEPTMQLTLSSVHTGGVQKYSNIVFEILLSKNKGPLLISDIINKHLDEKGVFRYYKKSYFKIKDKEYVLYPGDILLVKNNQIIKKNDPIVKHFKVFKIFAPEAGKITHLINAELIYKFDEINNVNNILCQPIDRKQNIYLVFKNKKNEVIKIQIEHNSYLLFKLGQTIQKMDILCSKNLLGVQEQGIVDSFVKLENLFEVRIPKNIAFLAPFDGHIIKNKQKYIFVEDTDKKKKRSITYGLFSLKEENEFVKKGEELTEGEQYVRDILNTKGSEASINFLIDKIYKIYCQNHIYCNIKYIELVAKAMHSKVKITKSNNINFQENNIYNKNVVSWHNKNCEKEEDKIKFKEIVLGLTKLGVSKSSIIATIAARETAKILSESVISGEEDKLESIESSILFGSPVKIGTGYPFSKEQKEFFAVKLLQNIQDISENEKNKIFNCFDWSKIYLLFLNLFFGKHNKFLLTILVNSIFYKFIKKNEFSLKHKYKDELLCETIKTIISFENISDIINMLE